MTLTPRARRLWGWVAALAAVGVLALGVRLIGGAEGAEGSGGGAAASPSFRTTGGAIAFGTALDPESGVIEVTSQTTRFRAGDTFAYAALGITPVPRVWVEVVRLSGEAPPEVVQAPTEQRVPADRPAISFTVPAGDLIDAWGPGEYRMRIFVSEGGAHAAEGVFTLEVPTTSPSAAQS